MNNPLEHCHEMGWCFLPLSGKVPTVSGWQNAPQAPLSDVIQWAKGNIGLRTGAASGVVVVDVDEGGKVPEGLPPTVQVATGGGGMHYYFKHPGYQIKNSVSKLSDAVDVRGDGGYVVFPGSLHPDSGLEYKWVRPPWEFEMAPLPVYIAEMHKADRPADAPAPVQPRNAPNYALSALVNEAKQVAASGEGGRNHALNKAAYKVGGLVGAGIAEQDAIDTLAHAGMEAGLSEDEATKTARSGVKAGMKKPRAVPAPRAARAAEHPTRPVASSRLPVEPLGYDEDYYYFYSPYREQMVALTVSKMTKLELISMAELKAWELAFISEESANVNWTSIANALMGACHKRGIFTPDRLRGRGAWYDNGHSVLHLGDSLIIDGEKSDLRDSRLHGIYQRSATLDLPEGGVLNRHSLLQLCDTLSWENRDHGRLLAGWIALAGVCGALRWRPHIWIVGERGSGKSTVLDSIIKKILGSVSAYFMSNTTEAGIRQELKSDALPVIFDEFEGDSAQALTRCDRTLELARQASSESGASIVKGSATGQAIRYRIRSMFCFSSINNSLLRAADTSRVSVLTLKRSSDPTRWPLVQELILRNCYPEVGAALIKHMAENIGVTLDNIQVFSRVIGLRLRDQRTGDQLGALVGGWWALQDGAPVTVEDARYILEDWDLSSDGIAPQSDLNDQQQCINAIMESRVEVDTRSGVRRLCVGELARMTAHPEIDDKAIHDALGRNGIKLAAEGVIISNQHTAIGAMLARTPFQRNWSDLLLRIPGAKKVNPGWFAGVKHRGVLVPWG